MQSGTGKTILENGAGERPAELTLTPHGVRTAVTAIQSSQFIDSVPHAMTTSKQETLYLASLECTFAMGIALTFAYQFVYPPPRVLAQRVDHKDQSGAEKIDPRAVAPTYLEIRSVIPDSLPQADGERPGRTVTYGLRYTDIDRLMASVPSINKAVPIREVPQRIRHLDNVVDGRVVGTTREYVGFNRLEIERGRFLTDLDQARSRDHAVLGSMAAKVLFPTEDPVGQTVDIGSGSFQVVGVARQVSTNGHDPQDSVKDIYIPLSTSKSRHGDWIVSTRDGRSQMRQLSRIIFQGREGVSVGESARLI